MKKILLDAGHYKNYNKGAYPSYYEGNMTIKLAKYLKEYLEKNYKVQVDLTHSGLTKEMGLYERGAKAKGYDAFYSLHSNATTDTKVTRVVIIRNCLSNKYDAYAKELGDAIKDCMGITQATQVWYKQNSSGNEYYGVLRGAKAVGCDERYIVEHGFHSNYEVAKWLYSDANIKKLAEAEGKVMAKHHKLAKKTTTTTTTTTTTNKTTYVTGVYRVTADTLNIRSGAGTSYDKVTTTSKGSAYTIDKISGNWGHLKSDIGWICLDYCELVSASVETKTETKTETYTTGVYKVIVDTLNVRSGAGTSYDKVDTVAKGSAFTITKVSGNWGYLKSGAGWINISKDYCEKIS